MRRFIEKPRLLPLEILENEVADARAVQNRLLKTPVPRLRTLDLDAYCRPARGVGGDFYDLLSLGPSRLGILLGDIAGKGVSAAILMASLQATLRSHYATGTGDLPQVLRSVNRLFFDWTASHHFATLFLGEYDDQTRLLSYVNCGHLPPLLMKPDGSLKRLESTATVVGILTDWDCEVGEVVLDPGDVLLVYSDGMSEGESPDGGEFGEQRLIESLRAARHLPVDSLIPSLIRIQKEFCGFRQSDDTTLVVARGRASLELVQ